MAAEFRQLPDLEIADYDEALPLGPPDLKHGVLPNGIRYVPLQVSQTARSLNTSCGVVHRYYVKTCAKPQKRAALALAIKIGSAVEQDDEQGVAHIVEHLAFNATEVGPRNFLYFVNPATWHASYKTESRLCITSCQIRDARLMQDRQHGNCVHADCNCAGSAVSCTTIIPCKLDIACPLHKCTHHILPS